MANTIELIDQKLDRLEVKIDAVTDMFYTIAKTEKRVDEIEYMQTMYIHKIKSIEKNIDNTNSGITLFKWISAVSLIAVTVLGVIVYSNIN